MRKHGYSTRDYTHPIYRVWQSMKRRCDSPKIKNYRHWGGRGIIVCDGWLNSFLIFCNWALDNGWREGLSLDRINNDGNYEPSNCRFITQADNNRNSRQTKLSWETVTEIRNVKLLIPEITQQEMSDTYGVCRIQIGLILNNKRWKEGT